MITHHDIHRLQTFKSLDAPVVSLYVDIPPDPGQLKSVRARLESLLEPVDQLIRSRELPHTPRESLRADAAQIMDVASRAGDYQGQAVAVFACHHCGLYDEIAVPSQLPERAIVDATPYLRPLLVALDEAHRYCAVVIDAKNSWLYLFYLGQLEEADKVPGWVPRRRTFGGGGPMDWDHVQHRADEKVKQHFRQTAQELEQLLALSGTDLVMVGGHAETVPEFVDLLPKAMRAKVAGTFVIDTHAVSPALVRERVTTLATDYERDEERELVRQATDRVGAHSLGAAGLEWCLAATDEQAVDVLMVDHDREVPGRACDTCGWLGRSRSECPVCSHATREVPDVIDYMATAVLESSGRVEHVYADTDLAQLTVAALLRFPVPEPPSPSAF